MLNIVLLLILCGAGICSDSYNIIKVDDYEKVVMGEKLDVVLKTLGDPGPGNTYGSIDKFDNAGELVPPDSFNNGLDKGRYRLIYYYTKVHRDGKSEEAQVAFRFRDGVLDKKWLCK